MTQRETDKAKGKKTASSAGKVMRDAKSGRNMETGSIPRGLVSGVYAKASAFPINKGSFAGGGAGEPLVPLTKLIERMTGQVSSEPVDTVELSRRVAEAERELAFIKESLAQAEMDRLIDFAGDDIQDVLDRLEDR